MTYINHELLSHFYNSTKRTPQGELANEERRGLLEVLQCPNYFMLQVWLYFDFINVDLDWEKIGAGSPHICALSNVLFFLELRIRKTVLDRVIQQWDKLNEKQKQNATINAKRLYESPAAKWHHAESKSYVKFKAFLELNNQ